MAPTAREQLTVFLRAIKHDPDDDAPRLVLADWLQDQGDPRGELLALDVGLDRLPEHDPRRAYLYRRERLLLGQYAFRWLGPLVDLPLVWRFERGFLSLEARAFGLLNDEVAELSRGDAFDFVIALRLTELRGVWLGRLANSPLLDLVPCLDLSENRVSDDGLAVLLESPRAQHLRSLTLTNNRLGPRAADSLAGCPRLANLRSLRLGRNRIGDDGALALAGSPHLNALTLLDVSNNHLSYEGLTALRGRFGDAVRPA